ncbi:MAG: hypothetical protein J6K99_01795 [Peptococcaceae bacterium]|nr:hypothetical protein [Peptococcaceae bacterium]MBP3341240.1 hypothetical protein [Peptococcaceae bacterium]
MRKKYFIAFCLLLVCFFLANFYTAYIETHFKEEEITESFCREIILKNYVDPKPSVEIVGIEKVGNVICVGYLMGTEIKHGDRLIFVKNDTENSRYVLTETYATRMLEEEEKISICSFGGDLAEYYVVLSHNPQLTAIEVVQDGEKTLIPVNKNPSMTLVKIPSKKRSSYFSINYVLEQN